MAASRLSRPFIAALLALLVLWLAALGVLAAGRNRQSFPADQVIDPQFSARPGVNLSRGDLAPGRLDATLQKLASEGIRFVRFTLPWDEIEPSQGQFAWDAWDAVAGSFARQPGLQPVVVLDRSPAWSRGPEDQNNPLAPSHERKDFGAFARAVAERYRGKFTYYQVWDEPNIAPHWGTKLADPADYAGLLREAAVNIRAADPSARIVAAALAPTSENGGINLSDIAYLDQLYNLGGREWFDYPAAQPYGFSQSAGSAANPSELNFSRVALLRQVMLRHGDAGTPLWATAFGWDASTGAEAGTWGSVSEAEQAAYTSAAFTRAAREWPWLGPLLWTGNFPMAPATQAAFSKASESPRVLGPGTYPPDTPTLKYAGWRVTPSAADPSAEGDTLEFQFDGTGVALDVQGGTYWAYLTATVDGAPANRLPRDESGASYLVLNDPNAATRLVPLASGLAPGTHTARLVAHGGWGQWPLRAVVISGANAGGLSRLLGWLLLALAVAATLAAVLVWQRAERSVVIPPGDGATNAGIPGNTVSSPALDATQGSTRSERIANVAVWVLAIGLCALFLLSTSGVVNLAILALLGLLFLARPELAPPLIAASLPWWQRTQPVLRWQFGLFEVLAWIAFLAWIARGVLAWLFYRARSPLQEMGIDAGRGSGRLPLFIDISVVALFASGLLASIFAAEQGVAWREFRIVFLFGLVFYVLITRAARGSVRNRSFALVLGLLAGATIASLAGLLQFVTGQGRVDVEGVGRIAAFYGSPNNLALILDRAVPLAAALALFGAGFWFAGTRSGRTMRIVFAAVAVLTLAAAVATFSKGAVLLGLPVGLAVILIGGAWRGRKRWPLWLLLALVVVAGLGLLVLFRTPRFADLFNFAGGTSFFRLKLWRGALNMALDHPLLGVGPDNFLYAYRTRYVLPSGWQELNLSHPHSLLLDLWTRLGLLGVVAGLGSLVVAFAAGWKGFVRGREGLEREDTKAIEGARHEDGGPAGASRGISAWPLMLGLLAGLAAAVAHGLIDNSLFLPDLMGWFVAAQAIFWLYGVNSGPEPDRSYNHANQGQN